MHCHHLQGEHPRQCQPQFAVAEEVGVEHAGVFGAGVEGVEELEQHESREGQGQGIGLILCRQAVLEHEQCADHHRRAIQREARQTGAGEDLRRLAARLVAHDAGAGRLDAQCHRRRAVHDDVDPQQLDRRERRRPAQQGGSQHRENRADVGGELEAHELDDVVVHHAAFLDGLDDGGEVVVGQHQGRRFLGHGGAGDAHRHADVGGLQRGCVVDAVAGHRGDMAVGFERLDDLHLVRGRDAGEHVDLVDAPGQLGIRHGVQLGAADHLAGQAQFAADGGGGELVVAGDHLDLDARFLAVRDGAFRLGARRVHQPG